MPDDLPVCPQRVTALPRDLQAYHALSAAMGRSRLPSSSFRMTVSVALATLLAGCSLAGTPTTIVVIDKDIQLRWESRVIGLQTGGGNNRVVEVRRNEIVRVYWLKDVDGRWYRVDLREFQAARLGQPLEILR